MSKEKFPQNFEVRIDRNFLFSELEDIINTPSPVGFYELGNQKLTEIAESLEVKYFTDERHCFYIELEGEDNSRTVLVGSHMDTLGYLVKHVNEDGSLQVKSLGGVNNCSLEHEQAYLFTRELRKFTGYITLKHHSVHVFDDARDMPREDSNMLFYLDEDVQCKADVESLDIQTGDIIAPEPRYIKLPNGRIRSRFLDDKAAVAASLTVVKYLKDHQLKPRYKTLFAFPYYEEVNAGGSYTPPEVKEYIAIDIGVTGPDNGGTERSISIVVGDRKFNYDRDMVTLLIACSKTRNLPYSTELFHRYSTDALLSFEKGNNLKHGAFGMNVFASHGVERTFDTSIIATAELCLQYVLRQKL